jgi:hypothetical protein
MSAQRQKPIDFAAEGLCLAISVNRNYGIRDAIQNLNKIKAPQEKKAKPQAKL